MKRTLYKWFWAWDFEKEETWLNALSAKGLQLCDVGFCRYAFEDGLPGEYIYRLELLDRFPSHPESAQYIRFIEETGAQHIGSLHRWVYFRKRAEEGEFDLFSDLDSRLAHLRRLLLLIGAVTAATLVNAASRLMIWLTARTGANLTVAIPLLALSGLLVWGLVPVVLTYRRLKRLKYLQE